MPETWKGKTRGGTFGYMFFIYMIRCLGITVANNPAKDSMLT